MNDSYKRMTNDIKNYEKHGLGNKAILQKQRQLELKKRLQDYFGT